MLFWVSSAAAQGFLNANSNPNGGLFVSPFRFGPTGSFQDILITALRTIISLSGLIAILFIIIGGFYYITAGGNEKQTEVGKNYILNSIIGLVIIIMAYVILSLTLNTIYYGP